MHSPWDIRIATLTQILNGLETSGSHANETTDAAFIRWRRMAQQVREQNKTLSLIGNGASASMASHFAADLTKNAYIRVQVFTDLAQLTAIGNDIGFESIYSVPLERYSNAGDMLVAISSSGRSSNILNAAKAMKERGGSVITLTGFSPDNPLRTMGDINFYVPAPTYGLVETCHAAILHHWMDGLIV